MDAGGAGRLATEHLIDTMNPRTVATFDVDSLIDYRSRRPPMIFDTNQWIEYKTPELKVQACEDAVGVPFLVLTGPEPDRLWEGFTAGVTSLVDRLDVSLSVGLHGIPMAVPHTRETELTPHGNRPDLLGESTSWISRVEVPGSATALMEYRLGEAGKDAIGFTAHVPHYLSQAEYPLAAIALLNGITAATGLAFRTGELEEAGRLARKQIDEQVAASDEIAEAVRGLEAVRRRRGGGDHEPAAGRAGRADAGRRGDRGRVRAVPRRTGRVRSRGSGAAGPLYALSPCRPT